MRTNTRSTAVFAPALLFAVVAPGTSTACGAPVSLSTVLTDTPSSTVGAHGLASVMVTDHVPVSPLSRLGLRLEANVDSRLDGDFLLFPWTTSSNGIPGMTMYTNCNNVGFSCIPLGLDYR